MVILVSHFFAVLCYIVTHLSLVLFYSDSLITVSYNTVLWSHFSTILYCMVTQVSHLLILVCCMVPYVLSIRFDYSSTVGYNLTISHIAIFTKVSYVPLCCMVAELLLNSGYNIACCSLLQGGCTTVLLTATW